MFSALIIDADGKTPTSIKNILAPYGFEFTITENGPEAVNVARQAAPDVIFLRAELPLTSGFSVCNRLRRHDDTRKIPLIMYSSNVSEDVFEQHRNLKTHADDYLRLPLDPERLLGAIRPFLTLPEPSRTPAPPPPAPASERSGSMKVPRPKTPGQRLDVELAEAPPPPRPVEPVKQFEQDFSDKFRALQDEPSAVTPAPSGPHAAASPDAEASDASLAAGGFKAQREVLQLKSQLNAKNRELLALRDDLEVRERTILDAKRQQRELQAQIAELETQSLQAQDEILSSREAAEAAQRDKQTALKREEGLKTRLEVTTKKLKDLETEFTNFRAQAGHERDKAAAALTEVQQRIALQASLITDLEAERDGVIAQLGAANQRIASLEGTVSAARTAIADLEQQLVDTRDASARALEKARVDTASALDAAAAERAAAITSLTQQHQAEIDERDAEYRAAEAKLQGELAALKAATDAERARLLQQIAETEENARLQIEQLTQTLAQTEDAARRQIAQLQATLAQTEEAARAEIGALQTTLAETRAHAEDAAAEAARRIGALEREVDELGAHLDRSEAALARRRDAAARAEQALAVALKVLADGQSE